MKRLIIALLLVGGCKTNVAEPVTGEPRTTAEELMKTDPEIDELPKAAREFVAEMNRDVANLRARFSGVSLVQAKTPEQVDTRLQDMVELDQYSRGKTTQVHALGLDEAAFQATMTEVVGLMTTIDEANTAELKSFVASNGWPKISEHGLIVSQNAWLIAQHADRDRDFQRDVLDRLQKLLADEEVEAGQYAYLYDRVATGEGRPQRYGTQGRCVGTGLWEPTELEDPEGVDARRAVVGLGTMDEYKATFVDLCK